MPAPDPALDTCAVVMTRRRAGQRALTPSLWAARGLAVLLALITTGCSSAPGSDLVGYWKARRASSDGDTLMHIHQDGDTWLFEGFKASDRCHPVEVYPLTLVDGQLRTAPILGSAGVFSYMPSSDTVLMSIATTSEVFDRTSAPDC